LPSVVLIDIGLKIGAIPIFAFKGFVIYKSAASCFEKLKLTLKKKNVGDASVAAIRKQLFLSYFTLGKFSNKFSDHWSRLTEEDFKNKDLRKFGNRGRIAMRLAISLLTQ